MLYTQASRIFELVEAKSGSVKSLTLNSHYQNKRQLMALVCETLKFSSLLQAVLDTTRLQHFETSLENTGLAKVLLFDFLLGKGLDKAESFQEIIERHAETLTAALDQIKASRNISNIRDFLKPSLVEVAVVPRYIRVNTLKSTVGKVIEQFQHENYSLVVTCDCDFSEYIRIIQNLTSEEFAVDLNIPELLVFAPGTEFHEHSLYHSGVIILQDKASCLPAHILNPLAESHVIDCCAAPGNKTSHLAAVMCNKGKIFAFDKDSQRTLTMKTLLAKAGASCVQTSCLDFLRVSPRDPTYAMVEYALVDPSCSGSGIVNRFSADDTGPELERRLESLGSFQAMILRHAMSFPSVRQVVYSTCSLHDRENELVVSDVLSRTAGTFRLVDIASSLGLPCRGNSTVFPGAEKCIRMTPETALTNGFFVARFERVAGSTQRDLQSVDHKTSQSRVNGESKDGQLQLGSKRRMTTDISTSNLADKKVCASVRQKKRRKTINKNSEYPAKSAKASVSRVKNRKQKRSRKHGGRKQVTA